MKFCRTHNIHYGEHLRNCPLCLGDKIGKLLDNGLTISEIHRKGLDMNKPVVVLRKGVLDTELFGDGIPFSKFMKLCAYQPPGYQFSQKFQDKKWDGFVRLAKSRKVGFIFPTGLSIKVEEFLRNEGFAVKIERKYQTKKFTTKDLSQLKISDFRNYQMDAVLAALNSKRGVIKAATAAGKTVIAAGIIKTLRKRSVFLVNTKTLLYQTAQRFSKEIGEKFVGIIGDGVSNINAITICSVPTLHRNYEKYKDFLDKIPLMFLDEAHHSSADTWYTVSRKIPALYRIGLTATPPTNQKKLLLESTTGPIIYDIGSKTLINRGYLSKPTIYMIRVTKPTIPERYDYRKSHNLGIIYNKVRNKKIVRVVDFFASKLKQIPCVIIVNRIDQMDELKKLFKKYTSLKVRSMQGSDVKLERDSVFNLASSAKIDVLIATTFDEGVDLPEILLLVIATGGTAPWKTIQRLGRGLRTTKTKNSVTVLDFMDETHPYLKKHSNSRKRTYQKEGFKVNILTRKKLEKNLIK